jgi:hypothetical protein
MTETADGAVRDERRTPFCYQTHDALDVLRATFDGNRRATALAIYLCLTEAANRSGGAAARDGFTAARKEVADAAGVSADTLDRYVAEMEAAGILRRDRRRVEGVNLPNVWVLVEPGQVPPVAAPVRPGGSRAGAAQGLKKELPKSEEGETSSPFVAPGPPPLVKVDGRNLGMDALAEECGIIDGDPRYGEVVAAINGKRGPTAAPGIRVLFWGECQRYAQTRVMAEPDLAAEIAARIARLHEAPEQFERALERAVHSKAARYRETLAGAILTPGALQKWWVSLEQMRPARGGLTPEEIERLGSEL